MILACLECKDNNAARVKKIMPGRLRVPTYMGASIMQTKNPPGIGRGPQKELDIAS